jgi:hypothetical protein
MAETANIAKMAEKISRELFADFFWQQEGPMNVNWQCQNKDLHQKATHPSDIVFSYEEPYSKDRTYINCDLKSYARESIKGSQIHGAIKSLAESITCAEISGEWQKLYTDQHKSALIYGLLFVYNHDGEYDRNFDAILSSVNLKDIRIPPRSKIVIMGPSDVRWLDNVRHEIVHMRGAGQINPARKDCRFYYPHLVRKKNIQGNAARAATLEMLTSPWIILEYNTVSTDSERGYVIFYRRSGESPNEFLYLIDYLFHYQILKNKNEVHLRTLDAHENASANFERAKKQYIEEYKGADSGLVELMNTIKYSQINAVLSRFSEVEIGMSYE